MGYDTNITIKGAVSNYDIDAVQVDDNTGDYRQVLVVGDFNASGTTGGMATVDASALYVSAINLPVTQGVSGSVTATLSDDDNSVLDTIDAVLDTIKVDTEAIETAVEGTLKVEVNPAITSYLSHVYVDLDAAGSNPTTNTEVVAAPGSSKKLVVYGVQGSISAGGAAHYGNWVFSDGNASDATTVWCGRTQGLEPQNFSISFPYGVALSENTALKLTSVEGSGNIYINSVVYYRTEDM